MPYPEAPVESSLPQLGSELRACIARPDLIDFLRRSLQIRPLVCSVGLPRRVSAHVSQRWLGGPHVRIKLGSTALFDATVCEVALPAEQAMELIDRVLGGTGRGLVPSKAGLPSAAECGVLAYFAARCVRACGADLRVQDVTSELLGGEASETVLWPVRLTSTDDLKLDLKLLFPQRACCPTTQVRARLSLTDTVDDPQLRELRAGDLLIGDSWSLHSTTEGPSGLLELSVLGSSERAQVVLEGTTLRLAHGALSARTPQTAELVVAQLSLGFSELAGLLADDTLPCPVLGEASLEARGAQLARGQLVRFLGQLALQVVDHSTR